MLADPMGVFQAPIFGRADAARALGVSVSYVNRLIYQGRAHPTVPCGLGPRRVFSLTDLRELAREIGRDDLFPPTGASV